MAALLLIIEVFTQMFWTMCLAIGCIGALIGELCGIGLAWELIILAPAHLRPMQPLLPSFSVGMNVSSKRRDARTAPEWKHCSDAAP